MEGSTVTVGRLRRSPEIVAVLRRGRQRAGRLAVLHVRPSEHEGPARIAVVASRKVGGAVARNRAKRLLRETARRVRWRPGVDVVLVARRSTSLSTAPEVNAEVEALATGLGVADSVTGAS